MEDPSHLEKLGRELKCPICLSLLSSAVSLTCNHVFCNSCIGKSMKSGYTCPVCKVPYRRREIRPAPHMDNLVTIYKSMEAASGFNIFVTQNAASTKLSDEEIQLENRIECQIKEKDQQTSRRKRSRKTTSSNSKTSGCATAKPSFQTNKRVHVPQRPLPETPESSKKLDMASAENADDKFRKSSVVSKDNCFPRKMAETLLSPFFWLRDEDDDADKLSQPTDNDSLLNITPLDIPTFSDLKDSDDEGCTKSSPKADFGGTSKAEVVYDSELFEWTQRACSPELFSTPLNTVVEDTETIEGVHGKKEDAPALGEEITKEYPIEDDHIPGLNAIDEFLTNLSSPNAEYAFSQSKPRMNSRKAILRKCSKTNGGSNEFASALQIDSGNSIQEERPENRDRPLNFKSGKRSKKVNFSTLSFQSRDKSVAPYPAEVETLTLNGEKTVEDFPARSPKTDCDNENITVQTVKVSKKINKRSNKRKLDPSEINNAKDADTIHNHEDVDTSQRHVKLSFVGSKSGLPDDYQSGNNLPVQNTENSETVMSVATQSTKITEGNGGSPILCDSLKSRKRSKSNGEGLSTGKTFCHKTECAFCLSSEDSEASGEMVCYCNGQPVAADYKSNSRVIHCHQNCVEWAPNVYFEDGKVFNLEAELARSRRIKCCCCGLKGAALGCYEKSCRKSFHVPCAKLTPQCRWDSDNFVMLCPLHHSSKLPNEDKATQERTKKGTKKLKTSINCNQTVPKQDGNTHKCWEPKPGKLVLCCSALAVGEREIVNEFERLSGVRVLKNWNLSVTHVIASTDENGACKRTLKFLMGILEGKWILTVGWVKACITAGKYVSEDKYEITRDVHGTRNGPQLGRLRILNKQSKIFEGLKFFIMGDFVPSYKGYIQDLVIAAGGAILHRKPIAGAYGAPDSSINSTFIVYSVEHSEMSDTNKKNNLNQRRMQAEALACSVGAKAVSNSWVLNSIAGCKLQKLC